MLNNIRNFSKTIFAKILLVIIIVPFVFWGMGGVFSSGNTNTIVKINNYSISTQDFIDYLNQSKLDQNVIKKNINNGVIEELLSGLISTTLLDMEIKKLNLSISENTLIKKIKNNKLFLDDNRKFSRTKYEKFLLSQNLTAPIFEKKLKNNELKKQLFAYISGGIKSPAFITNTVYKEQTGKLEIDFINLENIYKKKNTLTEIEIKDFINKNSEQLKEEYIDFSYIKITPKSLIGSDEFNNEFFNKIDDLENKISNNINFEALSAELKIVPTTKKKFIVRSNDNDIDKLVYENRIANKVQLIEKDDYYLLFNVNKINNILPSLDDAKFLNKMRNILFDKRKFEYNKDLLDKINSEKFDQNDFNKIGLNNIKNLKLTSIRDSEKFTVESVKILYTLPINSYTLVNNEKNDIFLVKIKNLSVENIQKTSEQYFNYIKQANMKLRDALYSSYDYFLNETYEVNVNQKTLERVKSYFK
tara:strand:- start:18 stop:1439 length:1422 start_codon:yes stop_codon:yes gene_type:complete